MDRIELLKNEMIDLHMNHMNENKGYLKNFESKTEEFARLLSSHYNDKEKAQKELLLFLAKLTSQTEKILCE